MKAQQLKNAILQLAIQGKLVPQDPNDEPASVLLEKIKQEKEKLIAEGKIKKSKKASDTPPYLNESEFPFEIPESWVWVRLNQLGEIVGGGTPKTDNDANWVNGKIAWITPADMKNVKGKYISKGERYITLEGLNSSSTKILSKSSIVYSSRAPIGYIAITDDALCTNQGFKSIDLYNKSVVDYLYYGLIYFTPLIQSRASGTTFKEISGTEFGKIIIPLLPLSEQKRIVAKIEELLPFIEQYAKKEQELTALHQAFPERLKKSILQAAIQGKLTEQHPNDEPAIELVKRIQAEKERLILEKKIKKPKQRSEIIVRDNSHYEIVDGVERCIDDEIPFEIPESWCWVRLGEVVIINPRNKINDELLTSFIPMNLIGDSYKNEHSHHIKIWKDIKSGFTHFAENDLAVAKITPCFENRKSVVLKNLMNKFGAGTTELFIFRGFNNLIFIDYLLWFVKSHYFINGGIKSYSGTAGQQRVSSDYIKNCLIPIPPLLEQKRIVAKIEQLFLSLENLG